MRTNTLDRVLLVLGMLAVAVAGTSLAASAVFPTASVYCLTAAYKPHSGSNPFIICYDPCPNDVCMQYENKVLGWTCTCENTLLVSCCDVFQTAAGLVSTSGFCGNVGGVRHCQDGTECGVLTQVVTLAGVRHTRSSPQCSN